MTDQAIAPSAARQDLNDTWAKAQALSQSQMLPKHFQGSPANVFLAMEIAHRLDLGVFEVAQNLYVVHGTPAFAAKYLIGLANQRGPFVGSLMFETEGSGKSLAVTCWAVHRQTGDRVEVTVSMAQAETAGWAKNAKYREIPEQMLSYRAATFLIRKYCPEVTLGFKTADEVEDVAAAEGSSPRVVDAEGGTVAGNVAAMIAGEPAPAPEAEGEDAPTIAPEDDAEILAEEQAVKGQQSLVDESGPDYD